MAAHYVLSNGSLCKLDFWH
uniref:Uncharacterized protein n=1 Tax=Rhizophora mucronata TaxID=61149 RepID=A0A2P2NX31_RHIMU